MIRETGHDTVSGAVGTGDEMIRDLEHCPDPATVDVAADTPKCAMCRRSRQFRYMFGDFRMVAPRKLRGSTKRQMREGRDLVRAPAGGAAMQQLSKIKWSYVTRGVVDRGGVGLASLDREPRLGDLVLTRVVELGAHDHVENTHGRRVRLYSEDVVAGAFGNRYATDYYEGYLPTGTEAHLLTAGGVVGRVASAHARRREPTVLEVLGLLADRSGRPLSLDDYAMAPPVPAQPELGTFVVVGSSMGAGKTTTASA
ncbi:hypothetical protein HF519_24640, partial [Pseudonocardia bannensis]|nr:hypothetical protein [Pseudonocardia bannensis]